MMLNNFFIDLIKLDETLKTVVAVRDGENFKDDDWRRKKRKENVGFYLDKILNFRDQIFNLDQR
jgi:hypothetical protein